MLPGAATPPQQASFSGWNCQPLWDLRCALGVSSSKPCCRDSKAQVEFQEFGIPAKSSQLVVLGPFPSTLDPNTLHSPGLHPLPYTAISPPRNSAQMNNWSMEHQEWAMKPGDEVRKGLGSFSESSHPALGFVGHSAALEPPSHLACCRGSLGAQRAPTYLSNEKQRPQFSQAEIQSRTLCSVGLVCLALVTSSVKWKPILSSLPRLRR